MTSRERFWNVTNHSTIFSDFAFWDHSWLYKSYTATRNSCEFSFEISYEKYETKFSSTLLNWCLERQRRLFCLATAPGQSPNVQLWLNYEGRVIEETCKLLVPPEPPPHPQPLPAKPSLICCCSVFRRSDKHLIILTPNQWLKAHSHVRLWIK